MQTLPGSHKYRIAIVDDQPDFLQFAVQELGQSDTFEVVATASGTPEFERLIEQRPDVALVDIFMPGANGFEVSRRLKQADPQLLVVYLSVDNIMQYPTMQEQLGDDTFVSKKWFSESYLTAVLTHYRRTGWVPASWLPEAAAAPSAPVVSGRD